MGGQDPLDFDSEYERFAADARAGPAGERGAVREELHCHLHLFVDRDEEVGRAALQGDFSAGEIRYDCSLSQAGFVAYLVQLTGPSDQLTSWSELFPIEELHPATTKLAVPRGTESLGAHNGKYASDFVTTDAGENLITMDAEFNAGLSVVLPIEHAVELIQSDELRSARLATLEAIKKQSGFRHTANEV